jgi:aldehyde:ferredoxin oxidoreductase
MLGGYMGKWLFVDLTRVEITEEALNEKLCRDFLGGYGIGARIMYSRQRGGVDPLGPENTIGLLTGPLTGSTRCWGTRYTVVAKSPLTGVWGDANSGGDFGPFLKFAGYDGVFFTGISDKPVYLLLKDGTAELKDAASIWGKDTHETKARLQSELGENLAVATIGPAGEKRALASAIISDNFRAAARAGLGAVMGSKKLKAVVAMGNQKIPIANPEALSVATKKFLAYIKTTPTGVGMHAAGTCANTEPSVATGNCPTKNWDGAGPLDFPNAAAISGKSVIDLQYKRHGCWRCPNPCGGLMEAGKQYNYPKGTYKPEYETLGSFGAMSLNDNLESIIMANDICNRYGLDTISAGAIIAFAIECYENGVITKRDTDGIELTWGNHSAIVAMLGKMARREGFGDVLADGVRVAAQKIGRGAEKYAIHVHGQEPSMHDPRFALGFGSAYTVAAEPGRHTQCGLAPLEEGAQVTGLELPERILARGVGYSGKGAVDSWLMNFNHAGNSMGICLFGDWTMPREAIPELMSCITGWDFTREEMVTTGERIFAIRLAFTLREGVTPMLDFKLGSRLNGAPPLKRGPLTDVTVDMKALFNDYYGALGWDLETGTPGKKRLLELGLDDIAADLWP